MADVLKKVPVREQEPKVRATNFEEVCYGYNKEEAMEEATRCLNCKNARCIQGCPVSINIPAFIAQIKDGNIEEAYKVIGQSSALPAICGRVCPQESQCESKCVRGIKGDAVSIGKLERFVADYALENDIKPEKPEKTNGQCYGYNKEEAMEEATRCLNCKNARCIQGCPVSINIPAFIAQIKDGNIEEAYKVIGQSSALPAICGRVCPQESQCESKCVRGIKGDAVSIGKLERFVADYALENDIKPEKPEKTNGHKVAVIGSGPSGLTCAGDLAKLGYEVTVFEALHELGGVLVYGIPEFRLPKQKVVKKEIEKVKELGVKFETNVVIGKSTTIDQLMEEEDFEAVFIGSGAGLPMFMGIPGETANGVFSANEYLTRSNLMKAFDDSYDTPIAAGKKVAVVGGGNVAMDAARTALRLGAEVHIVYRRSEAELPARVEEVHHAKEEGVQFDLLTNPKEILVDENGWVKGMKVIKMELGEPDASGRRRPIEIPGSEYEIELDTVIMSLGTSPNPLISSTTKGLETNKRKCIVAEEENGQTSKAAVFAGGDAVTGAATVILAMGAGKAGAKGIHEYLSKKNA